MRRTAVDAESLRPRGRHRHALAVESRRTRRAAAAIVLLVVLAVALPATATALGGRDDATDGSARHDAAPRAVVGDARDLPTVEDEDSWCAYLASHYVSFPSPWTARVINCRHGDLFVAPVHSDGSHGMCVLVPARHSRHLGGSIARWVTDTRLC